MEFSPQATSEIEEIADRIDCPFSVSFGSDLLCACPLRLYIATNYGK